MASTVFMLLVLVLVLQPQTGTWAVMAPALALPDKERCEAMSAIVTETLVTQGKTPFATCVEVPAPFTGE